MNSRLLLIGLIAVIIVLTIVYFVSAPPKQGVSLDDGSSQETSQGVDTNSNSSDTNNSSEESMQDITKLNVVTVQEGTGEAAKAGDTITVHYRGTLLNGTPFDSSYERGTPFSFQLGEGRVIAGWEQGLVGAKMGQKLRLEIPSELAYGSRAMGPISANSDLIFEVEVVSISPAS